MMLVIGETKVSGEAKSPPQVVDQSADSLRNQHLGHLNDREVTANKIFHSARHALDRDVRDLLFAGADGAATAIPCQFRAWTGTLSGHGNLAGVGYRDSAGSGNGL
jgi:hypothetical protein